MKALVLEAVQTLAVRDVPDPRPSPGDVLVKVFANGVCRSDWHAWVGDFPRKFPIIMGHEIAGIVEEVTPVVTRFRKGDRVVVPFSGSDGTCEYCVQGKQHLCNAAAFPGISYPGGYAEYLSVPNGDRGLVHLPEEISFTEGAALGCRFMTSFHGVVDRAKVQAGEWVAVYGCGGVGLSAINIAAALGARPIGIDLNADNLKLARDLGAEAVVDARAVSDPAEAIMQITDGGAHVSIDALGNTATCVNGIKSLRKEGRHLQVGLTSKKEAGHIAIPIDLIVRRELQLLGTLGMAPHRFASMIPLVASGRLSPGKMVTSEIGLSQVHGIFEDMTRSAVTGAHIVTRFDA